MTKAEYLFQLENELSQNLEQNEVQSILVDYNEYFETGNQDGLSDEELCQQFGTPFTVAMEIFQSLGIKAGKQSVWASYHANLAGQVLFFAFMSLLLFLQGRFAYNKGASVFIAVLIPFVFMKWRNSKRFLPPLQPSLMKRLSYLAFAPFANYVFAWFVFDGILAFIWILQLYTGDLSLLGPSIDRNLDVLYSFSLGCMLLSFIRAYAHGIGKRYSITFFLSGFMQSIGCLRILLHTLADPKAFWPGIFISLIPLGVGIATYLLARLLISDSAQARGEA